VIGELCGHQQGHQLLVDSLPGGINQIPQIFWMMQMLITKAHLRVMSLRWAMLMEGDST